MAKAKVQVKDLHGLTIGFVKDLKDKAGSERIRLQIDAILMSFGRTPVQKISEKLGVHPETIYKYVHEWNRDGLRSLRLIEFAQNQDGDVCRDLKIAIFEQPPNGCKWTIPMLQEYINDKYNARYTYYKIRTILCALGGIRCLKAELSRRISEESTTS